MTRCLLATEARLAGLDHKRVRALNADERRWVIWKHEEHLFRKVLWLRSKIWIKTVSVGAAGALAFVNFGSDFIGALAKLLATLGWK